MIRVLIIETTAFGYDGITNVVTNYYKYQNHNRVHMELVTINPVSDSFKAEMDNSESRNYILPYRNQNPLKYIFQLIKIIKREKYQVVHVHGCSATMAVEMVAAKIAGVKVRISHSHNTKCDHVKVDKILRPVFNICCNVGFACGKEAGEWMFPKTPFSVISNGVDIEKYQFNEKVRSEMRQKFDLTENFVIGHVGRFSLQKNHDKLIDIFKEISKEFSNAKLVLIGDGELRKKIEKRVDEEKLNVLFVGLSDKVEKWLQAMDMIVFPSLFEGLPLGLVEAQAAGLPCVLSDTISPDTKITDLIEFVELDSPLNTWVKAVKRNYNNFDRKARIDVVKQQIRESHFDIRTNCEELANKYEKLIKSRRK